MSAKIVLGQFYTVSRSWLKPQIVDFIKSCGASIAYDPFAGKGDLLDVAKSFLGFNETIGLDLDEKLNWERNDSLKNIPHIDNAIIITNPPYISNYSASRKKVIDQLFDYFQATEYDDLYLLALDKMLEAQDYVVAIIPETFINSGYKQKNRLSQITILEENPFMDTETPTIVACFDGKSKDKDQVRVYKNDNYVGTLGQMERTRLVPKKNIEINFNDKNGWLGVRCVDTTNPNNMIIFDFKENIDYDWAGGIKISSRLLTLIGVDVPEKKRQEFLTKCNEILLELREKSADVILSPFKGNMKNGRRRRRLDFRTCRAIIEQAYCDSVKEG